MKHITLIILLILVQSKTFGQTEIPNTDFLPVESVLITNHKIFAVDTIGKLNIWDLNSLNKTYSSGNVNTVFNCVSKDRFGQFYIGTKKGRILKFNPENHSFTEFLKLEKTFWKVEEIIFNSKNEMFLILPFGIYEPKSDELWTKFEHSGVLMRVYTRTFLWFKKELEKYFSNPEYVFIDSSGIIWMSKTFGEFGSVMQLFDLENKKIINPNDSLNYGNPKSIFEDDKKNIFITSGLMHFSQSGAFYRVKDLKTVNRYESKEFKTKNGNLAFPNKIFIGPGIFNDENEKIYFSTTNGIYKADFVKESGFINTELVFEPKLIWKQEPLAIGVDMAIKKIAFSSLGDLIIITANNGIGVYRNNELIWLN